MDIQGTPIGQSTQGTKVRRIEREIQIQTLLDPLLSLFYVTCILSQKFI